MCNCFLLFYATTESHVLHLKQGCIEWAAIYMFIIKTLLPLQKCIYLFRLLIFIKFLIHLLKFISYACGLVTCMSCQWSLKSQVMKFKNILCENAVSVCLFTYTGMLTWSPWWDTVCRRSIWPGALLTLRQSHGGGQEAKPSTGALGSSTPGSETPQWQVSLGPGKGQWEGEKKCSSRW